MHSIRPRRAPLAVVCLALLLSACVDQLKEVGREPALSPVGTGLAPERTPHVALPATQAAYRSGNTTWQDSGADLFRDARAFRVGDVVTVKVQINDKANLDSTLNRSREGKNNLTSALDYNFA